MKTKGLNTNQLKYIAIAAMLIDHIGWKFLDFHTPIGFLARVIGRLTIPIMCYFIAEGYNKTSDVKRYASRLFIFAVISHIPYVYLANGRLPASVTEFAANVFDTSVMWPLFLALIALIVRNSSKLNGLLKTVIIVLLCGLAFFADWMFFPIVWAIVFDSFKGEPKKQMVWFAATAIPIMLLEPVVYLINGYGFVGASFFQFGLLIAIVPLMMYNGERGKSRLSKWVFYIFYPLHLLVLALIKS